MGLLFPTAGREMESPYSGQKPLYLKALLGSFGLFSLFLRHGLHTLAYRHQAGSINKCSGLGGAGPTVVRSSDFFRGAPKSSI